MRLGGLLVALVLAATACSGGGDDAATSTTTSSTTTTEPAPADTTAGCGVPPPELGSAQEATLQLESSGGTREYLVLVSPDYSPDVAAPVAFVFHGAGSNKVQQQVYSNFTPRAMEAGAILVLPDALGEPKRWSPFGIAGVAGVDDLVFFDDLYAAIGEQFCVDPDRVLVSGMSSGGFMSAAVACGRPDVVSTVGPVTATMWVEALCDRSSPTPYVYFHGTADPVVPFDGRVGAAGISPGAVEETAQGWAEHNGCDPSPTDTDVGEEVIHRSWSECEASTDLYIVEGGGHTWPGAAIEIGGHTTHDIDATEIIWETFEASWPD